MTPLSRSSSLAGWTLAELPALARSSLYLLVTMLWGVPTCLVTSTTDFPTPVPSAPFINPNTALATPLGASGVPITKVLVIDPDADPKSIDFSVDVQSEDNGRPLYARVYVNYNVDQEHFKRFRGGDTLEPATFDSVRTITGTLPTSDLDPGCNQVALVITHTFDNRYSIPAYPADTALVVWWVLKEHAPEALMASCPGAVAPPPFDAGSDAPDAEGD